MMVHMFASDYDGTLFKDHIIRDSDLDAIKKFRALGHKFGIVTGRSIDSIRHEIEIYNIPVDFVVGINGGVVLDHDYKELYSSKIDSEVIEEILDFVDNHGVGFYGANDGYKMSHSILKNIDEVPFKQEVKLYPLSEIKDSGVLSIFVWNETMEKAKELSKYVNDTFGHRGVVSYSNFSSLDIGANDVTKATGIEIIRNHYGYNGHVYAIGDSYNDVPMIKEYHGFLMDNGEPELEGFAKGGLSNTVGDALNLVMESF